MVTKQVQIQKENLSRQHVILDALIVFLELLYSRIWICLIFEEVCIIYSIIFTNPISKKKFGPMNFIQHD